MRLRRFLPPSPTLLLLAGFSILAALVGSAFVDPLWMMLVPAALLLIPGVQALRRAGPPSVRRPGPLGAFVLQLSCGALLALNLVGALAQVRFGVEPRWFPRWLTWTSIAFVGGAALLGAGIARSRGAPRLAGATLAASLPLGLASDQVLSKIPGIFLYGWGFYAGLGIFALCLVWIALRISSRSVWSG
ncbi:MAG: hypothetical protein M3198_00325 [Actinomycetota bacterium]|nr:hypothetical protein [Actinomycetota bacterium]